MFTFNVIYTITYIYRWKIAQCSHTATIDRRSSSVAFQWFLERYLLMLISFQLWVVIGGIGGFLKGSSGGVAAAGGQKEVRIGVSMVR